MAKILFLGILRIGGDVHKRIKSIDMAAHERSRITKRVDLLLQLITDLQSRDLEELPGPAMSALDDVMERIQACEQICEATQQQSQVTKFIKAHTNLSQIVRLENELERAVNSANLAISAVNLVLADRVHKTIKSESLKTQSLVQNPMAGFYMVNDDNMLKPPAQLPAPRVRRDGDLLVVSWSDPNNTPESLKFYELKYTDTDQLPSIPPKYTSVKLGPPKVQPGHTYTLCIRGVNECGPGEWSLSTVACFQDDEKIHSNDEQTTQKVPNNEIASQRQLLMADVTASIGDISVSLTSKSLPKNPASALTTLSPQTCPDATSSVPMAQPVPVQQTLPYPIKDSMPSPTAWSQKQPAPVVPAQPLQSHNVSIHPVPQSTNGLLVLPSTPMPNAFVHAAPITYTSVPSAPLPLTSVPVAPVPGAPISSNSIPSALQPSIPVPGAPLDLRISSKRTETLIKLRWQPPSIFPEAAACYELEMHPIMSFKVSWKFVATTDKLSAKVTHLQPNTMYEFRLRSMNPVGTSGPYSETITGSTKGSVSSTGSVSRSTYSGLSKLAASSSSFFGSSKLKGRNTSGVGEYVFGGLSRSIKSAGDYLGNKAKVEDDSISPQSSDDEK